MFLMMPAERFAVLTMLITSKPSSSFARIAGMHCGGCCKSASMQMTAPSA